jgi:4-aminobutyrate aminotransferase-like enzyme
VDIRERYIERLLTKVPPSLSVCYLLHSIHEATEIALRLARAHRPGKDVIVLDDVDYGITTSLANMSPGRRKFWVQAASRTDVSTVADKARLIQSSGRGLCGFFAEGRFPDGYLRDAYAAVRAAGGLNVAIERKSDPAFWEFARQRAEPDIVVLDSLAGDFPLAAVVTRPDLSAPFETGTAGNSAACAAGLAVLDALSSREDT